MTKTGMQPCCRCTKREAPPWHRIGREEDAPAKSRPLRRHGTKDEQRSVRSEEHTSELQSLTNLVCRLLLEKKKKRKKQKAWSNSVSRIENGSEKPLSRFRAERRKVMQD